MSPVSDLVGCRTSSRRLPPHAPSFSARRSGYFLLIGALSTAILSCGPAPPPPLSLDEVTAAEGVVPALREWVPEEG